MKKAGVIIDDWKLPVFKKHLDAAGYKLATRYHTECEAYDQTVCSGPMGRDGIMPANYREAWLINRNAHAVRKRLTEEAAREGIGREELARAISKWNGSLPNDRVEGRAAALSRRVPSHDGLCGAVDTESET